MLEIPDMEERLEKIKKLITDASKIALLLAPQPKEEEFLLKEVLRMSLEETGKKIFTWPENPEIFRERWSSFLKPVSSQFPEKILIKLPGKVRLEEIINESDSTLVLTPEGQIEAEKIIIEKGLARPEAIIAFLENKEILDNLQSKIPLPDEDRIIFLGSKTRTLSEKVYDLLKLIRPESISKEATLLFGSLLVETERFEKIQTPGVFGLAKALLEAGAEREKLESALNPAPSQAEAQLLGRALARSQSDSTQRVTWTFLSRGDFEKTHQLYGQGTLLKLKDNLKTFRDHKNLALLLWEGGENKIWGLASWTQEAPVKLAAALGQNVQGDYFFFGPFPNFSEAEKTLKELLKENWLG